MHLLLTDLLSCPRCGPGFGLIVLADRIDDRFVVEGRLGCANCRATYLIEGAVADLRGGADSSLPEPLGFEADDERVFRAAALMGVSRPEAPVLVVGETGEVGRKMSAQLPEVHVIAATGSPAEADRRARPGMRSSILTSGRFPLRDRSVHGVALLGYWSPELAAEAARVLAPGARLVVDPAPAGAANHLRELGFTIHLEQDEVVVAAASGPR